ncbi:ATP-grasp domain-containing protein [Streptomyces sp. NPDC048357]|uniref:ATP-grasp domain-containing protein n=1 Tax=Streptomyces sp. NPDC048357 TaxID=3154719 RepID=UPI0034454E58
MESRTPSVLLLSAARTSTAELIARAPAWRGYDVTDRAAGAEGRKVHWYGGPRAAARHAGPLGLGLFEPADDWLTNLPRPLLRRRVRLTTLGEARELRERAFVKPPSAKIDVLPAAVHEDGTRLPGGLDGSTPVLVSGVVEFATEYRLFVLDGEAVTGSRYAVHGRLDPAPLDAESRAFARTVLDATASGLPSAVRLEVSRDPRGRLHGVRVVPRDPHPPTHRPYLPARGIQQSAAADLHERHIEGRRRARARIRAA